MNELDQLAITFGTDKSSQHHNYTKYYDRYFSPLRQSCQKLLEIGIDRGHSLRLWKEYFRNAEIMGIDISPECKKYEEERIRTFVANQAETGTLIMFAFENGPFDIVIDDGSHRSHDQIASFGALFNHVKSQGVYVIEDTNTSYWEEYGGGGANSLMEFLKIIADEVNFCGKRIGGRNKTANAEVLIKHLSAQNNLTGLEKTVESIHFYSGLAFIFKR